MRKTFSLALAAALFAAAPALAAKRDNSVRFAYDQVPENVDPYFNNVRIGVIISQQVWDTLIYRDPNTGEYKGQLAKDWKQVDDRTIEFELRQGVKFHNGEEFDADDVVYTLNFVVEAREQGRHPDERQLDRPGREDRQVQGPARHEEGLSGRDRVSRRPGGDPPE